MLIVYIIYTYLTLLDVVINHYIPQGYKLYNLEVYITIYIILIQIIYVRNICQELLAQLKENKAHIHASSMEIYNERVADLLDRRNTRTKYI